MDNTLEESLSIVKYLDVLGYEICFRKKVI